MGEIYPVGERIYLGAKYGTGIFKAKCYVLSQAVSTLSFMYLKLSVKQQLLIVDGMLQDECVGNHRLLTASNYVKRIDSHTHSHTLVYTCAFRKDHCTFQMKNLSPLGLRLFDKQK